MKLSNRNVVISKIKPKSKHVFWLDTSSNPPVMKRFINGEWVIISDLQSNGNNNSGCTCLNEIPYDQLIEITPFREPTDKDLAKLPSGIGVTYTEVLDLQDGMIPKLIIIKDENSSEGDEDIYIILCYEINYLNGLINIVKYKSYNGSIDNIYYIPEDGTLMACVSGQPIVPIDNNE